MFCIKKKVSSENTHQLAAVESICVYKMFGSLCMFWPKRSCLKKRCVRLGAFIKDAERESQKDSMYWLMDLEKYWACLGCVSDSATLRLCAWSKETEKMLFKWESTSLENDDWIVIMIESIHHLHIFTHIHIFIICHVEKLTICLFCLAPF